MAIVNKRRRNQSVDELKTLLKSYLPNQEEPTTLRIAAYKPGPGSELRKMLAWFARPSDTCKCETRAETMARNSGTVPEFFKGDKKGTKGTSTPHPLTKRRRKSLETRDFPRAVGFSHFPRPKGAK